MSMAVDKSRHDIKNDLPLSWKRPDWESNPGLLGVKRERYLCAMQPPIFNDLLVFKNTVVLINLNIDILHERTSLRPRKHYSQG